MHVKLHVIKNVGSMNVMATLNDKPLRLVPDEALFLLDSDDVVDIIICNVERFYNMSQGVMRYFLGINGGTLAAHASACVRQRREEAILSERARERVLRPVFAAWTNVVWHCMRPPQPPPGPRASRACPSSSRRGPIRPPRASMGRMSPEKLSEVQGRLWACSGHSDSGGAHALGSRLVGDYALHLSVSTLFTAATVAKVGSHDPSLPSLHVTPPPFPPPFPSLHADK